MALMCTLLYYQQIRQSSLGNINKIHLIFQEQVLLVYFFFEKKKYYNLCFQTFFDDTYFLNFSHFA